MPGGFSNITYFSSFGKGAGVAELLVSMYFIKRGGFTLRLNKDFIRHIGGGNPTKNKYQKDNFPNSTVSKKLTKDWADYDEWVKKQG